VYEGLYDTRHGLSKEDAELVGAMTARLLLPWDRWVHRRVDHVKFCDEDAVRRSISVDFHLPDWFHRARHTPKDKALRQLVPLGFLRKSALVNFTLRDEAGASLPLLTSGQNAQVAEAVLSVLAKDALGGSAPDLIQGDIHDLVRDPVNIAANTHFNLFNAHDPAWKARDTLQRNSQFFNMATSLRDNFLALTMVDIQRNQRRVLHLSYEKLLWDRRGLRVQIPRMWSLATGHPRILYITIPAVSESDSHHLELEAPDGLMITRRESYSILESNEEITRNSAPGGYRRAHFHCANAAPRSKAIAVVHLRPRSSSVVRAATLMASLALLATLAVGIRYKHIEKGDSASTAALLLAAAGIVGLIVVRSGEDELATALLYPLRILAVIPVVLAVCATIVVVVGPPPVYGYTALSVLFLGMLFSTGLLARNWYLIRLATRKYAKKVMQSSDDSSFT
jgi:hypothetical protein